MRISDWSSDVCSSDLWIRRERAARPLPDLAVHLLQSADVACRLRSQAAGLDEIAADRDAVCGVFPFRFARQTLAGPARIRIGFVIAPMRYRRRRIGRQIGRAPGGEKMWRSGLIPGVALFLKKK